MAKKTTKTVAEKTTTVAKEATPKKPTVKQLQEILTLKENLIISLESDVFAAKGTLQSAAEHTLKIEAYTRSLEDKVNELESVSWWQFTKDRLAQTFIRWFGGVG